MGSHAAHPNITKFDMTLTPALSPKQTHPHPRICRSCIEMKDRLRV